MKWAYRFQGVKTRPPSFFVSRWLRPPTPAKLYPATTWRWTIKSARSHIHVRKSAGASGNAGIPTPHSDSAPHSVTTSMIMSALWCRAAMAVRKECRVMYYHAAAAAAAATYSSDALSRASLLIEPSFGGFHATINDNGFCLTNCASLQFLARPVRYLARLAGSFAVPLFSSIAAKTPRWVGLTHSFPTIGLNYPNLAVGPFDLGNGLFFPISVLTTTYFIVHKLARENRSLAQSRRIKINNYS